jgi:acetyl esterase
MSKNKNKPNLFTRAIRQSLEWVVDSAALFTPHQEREAALESVDDVPYVDGAGSHRTLDVVRLKGSSGVQPALLYIHGGGFAVCSKETHRFFAYQYAKLGFTVFNINYRLMPEHRFPAAIHDSIDALHWVLDHGERYGADTDRLVVAGESAGANLSTAITASACYDSISDPKAQSVFERNPTIQAVMPACGLLQVSNCARLWRRGEPIPGIARTIFSALERDYLPHPLVGPGRPELADPLLIMESREPQRELPPMFIYCGTKDYVYDDSARLARALRRRGAHHEFHSYEEMDHAFHAFPWSFEGKKCWKAQQRFLQERVPGLIDRPVVDGGFHVSNREEKLRESA